MKHDTSVKRFYKAQEVSSNEPGSGEWLDKIMGLDKSTSRSISIQSMARFSIDLLDFSLIVNLFLPRK